jgi:flagellar biosynthesis chaperone FliJ
MHKRERKAYERENRQRAIALNEKIREQVDMDEQARRVIEQYPHGVRER